MRIYNEQELVASCITGDGAVAGLEARFAALLKGHFYCLSVINATSGLAALLRCLPSGKVITALFTSPATWAAIEHAGHEVVFSDIDPLSVCLSPQAIARDIAAKRLQAKDAIRALVTVNIFGHMSDLASLSRLAQEFGALLVVDAAQSLSTCVSNPDALTCADAVVFSLGPNKWLSCADGGLLAIKSHKRWQMLVETTQHATRQMLDLAHSMPNLCHYNYRINPHTALRACEMLEDIEARIERVRLQQANVIDKLQKRGAIQALPATDNTIFEPLTVIPRSRRRAATRFLNLPIPSQAGLAEKLDLSETLRQFRRRKQVWVGDICPEIDDRRRLG